MRSPQSSIIVQIQEDYEQKKLLKNFKNVLKKMFSFCFSGYSLNTGRTEGERQHSKLSCLEPEELHSLGGKFSLLEIGTLGLGICS